MTEAFLTDLLQEVLKDKQVRDAIEKLRDNASELGTLVAKQISVHVINNVLTNVANQSPAVAQSSVVSTKPTRGKRIIDWAKASDATLRGSFYYRKKRNLPIEPELSKMLVERFPGWDATTQTFTHAQPKQRLATKRQPIDWASASDVKLRSVFYYRKKRNLPIEPELAKMLAERFTGWNAETQTFTGTRTKRNKATKPTVKKSIDTSGTKNTPNTKEALVPLFCTQVADGQFSLHFDNGTTTQRLLVRASKPYELCLFDIKTKYAVIRKIDRGGQAHLFIIDCNTGQLIPENKPEINFVRWDKGSHDLYALKNMDSLRSGWHIMEHGRVAKPVFISHNAQTIRAIAINSDTVILDGDGSAHVGDTVALSDYDGISQQNSTIKKILFNGLASAKTQAVDNPPVNVEAPTNPQPVAPVAKTGTGSDKQVLRIKIKPVRTTLQGTYNNITVNGRRILSNHVDTEIKLLADGEVLAIGGIVTDDKTVSETMQWRVYFADLTSAIPVMKQSYSGYNAHAKAVYQMPDGGLRIDMSNKCSVFAKADKIRKIANGRKFVLDEKQK